MSDLVKSLRDNAECGRYCGTDYMRAADEIERLRARVAELEAGSAAFNCAINYAIEGCGNDAVIFLNAWREGDWQCLVQEFPDFGEPPFAPQPVKGEADASSCCTQVPDVFELGWRMAAEWAGRDDLIADIDSPAYVADREDMLAAQENKK